MYRIILLLFPLTFCLISCQEDAFLSVQDDMAGNEADIGMEEENDVYPHVDQELKTYLSRFETEAARRNLSYDLDQLIGYVESIPEENVAGQCSYNSHRPNIISVDAEIWERLSDLYREFIVFHELGHCVLGRGHDESSNGQGTCLSIMRSGLGDCNDAYTSSNRDYYLDELFYND